MNEEAILLLIIFFQAISFNKMRLLFVLVLIRVITYIICIHN